MKSHFEQIFSILVTVAIAVTAPLSLQYGATAETLDWLAFSPCELQHDPNVNPPPISLCIEGTSGLWATQLSHIDDGDQQPPFLSDNAGSARVTFGSWLTFAAGGYVRFAQSREPKPERNRDAQRDFAVAQIGNPSLHRHRFLTGVSVLPFGLHRNVNLAWSDRQRDRAFYGPPIQMATYVYDNQKDLTAYFGSGSIHETQSPDQNGTSAKTYAGSTRVVYDISALEGTRIETSFYSDTNTRQKASFAMLNVNGKGEKTAVEIIRCWSRYPYDPQDFTQLLRVNWEGIPEYSRIVHAQYDDVPNIERIGTLGLIWIAAPAVHLHWEVGYRRDEAVRSRSAWLGAFGLEVVL